MITVKDIETKTFDKSFMGGYKPEEVNDFLDLICESFKMIAKEKDDLNAEILMLNKNIDKYKQDEEYLKKAILEAHRLKDDLRETAQISANTIIKEAQVKASELETNAKNAAEKLLNEASEEARKLKNEAKEEAKITSCNLAIEIENEQKLLECLKKEVHDFKSKLFSIYKDHLESLNDVSTMIKNIDMHDDEVKKISEKNSIAKEEKIDELDKSNNNSIVENYTDDLDDVSTSDDNEIENIADNITKDSYNTAEFASIASDTRRVEYIYDKISDIANIESENQVYDDKNDEQEKHKLDSKYNMSDLEDVFSESKDKYNDIKFGVDYDITSDFDYETGEIDLSSKKVDKKKNKFKHK